MPVRGTVCQEKTKSLLLSSPLVSVQHSQLHPVIHAWLGTSHNPQHHQPCYSVLQLLIQNAWHLLMVGSGDSSAPFQPAWPRGQMTAMPSLNPGPELPVQPHFRFLPQWATSPIPFMFRLSPAVIVSAGRHGPMMQSELPPSSPAGAASPPAPLLPAMG